MSARPLPFAILNRTSLSLDGRFANVIETLKVSSKTQWVQPWSKSFHSHAHTAWLPWVLQLTIPILACLVVIAIWKKCMVCNSQWTQKTWPIALEQSWDSALIILSVLFPMPCVAGIIYSYCIAIMQCKLGSFRAKLWKKQMDMYYFVTCVAVAGVMFQV